MSQISSARFQTPGWCVTIMTPLVGSFSRTKRSKRIASCSSRWEVVSSRNIHFGRRKINRARAIRCFSPLERISPQRSWSWIRAANFPRPTWCSTSLNDLSSTGRGSALQIISFSKPLLINGVCDTYQLSAGEEISPLNHGQQWDNVLSSVVFPAPE